MNISIKKIMTSLSYSVFANMMSLVISTAMIFIIPKLIGVEEYGYWQLYTFYAGYIGFFHLGWCDGIYLRYGGKDYKTLSKPLFGSQFWILLLLEIIVSLFLMILVIMVSPVSEKTFVLKLVILSISIITSKTFLSYVLQATNRIKEYSIVTLSEKIVYLILSMAIIAMGIKSFKPLIIADIVGKVASLLIAVYFCKTIVFSKISVCMKEILLNLSVGSKLMIANIAGTLILGIVRLSIENQWSIETFGKISLSLSVSNIIIIFINAIGIVIFPMIKRTSEKKMGEMYEMIRNVLMFSIFFILLIYYPVEYILGKWLPQYAESLRYMVLLFPICIFESKMSLLVNTYLKALRKEKIMLACNFLSVLLSLILTFINVYLLQNLELAVLSIVVLFGFRCILSEIILSKFLNKRLCRDIIYEVVLCIIFITFGWFFNGLIGFSLYFLCYLLYVFIKRKDIKKILLFVRKI